MPSDPPISFESALRAEVRTNVVCMLCPSNGDVLATPLVFSCLQRGFWATI